MKTVNNPNSIWMPAIFENLFVENKSDKLYNYETFSTPAINIIETLSSFEVEIAAPGLSKQDFSIEVEEDTLRISSNKVEKENKEEVKYSKREFNYNSFERSFKLSEEIKREEIEANYVNGVLTVSLPKLEEKKVFRKMVEIS